MTSDAPAFTADELLDYISEIFPQVDSMNLKIDAMSRQNLRLRWPSTERHLRPGGTISGPAMMTLADTAAYFQVLANRGPVPLAVTTNLNVHFLKKPQPGDLIAEAELLKMGTRLVVSSVHLYSSDSPEVVAHATVTYSVPPPKSGAPSG